MADPRQVNLSRHAILAFVALLFFSLPLDAQIPSTVAKRLVTQDSAAGSESGLAAGASLDEQLAQFPALISGTEELLRNAELQQESEIPGSEPEERAERASLYRQLLRHFQRHLDILSRLKLLQEAAQDLDAEVQQRLVEQPPFSIDVVDGLWAEVQAKSAEIDTAVNAQKLNETLLTEHQDLVSQLQQALRQAQERLEAEAGDVTLERLRWLRDLAELRSASAEAGLQSLEAEQQLLKQTLAQHRRVLTQLRAQAKSATLSSPLSKEDRDAKLKAIADRREALKQSLHQATQRLEAARDRVQLARTRLDLARRSIPEDSPARDADLQRLSSLQARLDGQNILAETERFELETLRQLDDSLSLEVQVWNLRYELAHNPSSRSLDQALEQVLGYQNKIAQEREKFQSRMTSVFASIESQRQQIAGLAANDANLGLARSVLGSYEKRMNFYRWYLTRGEEVLGLLWRWRAEIEVYGGALTFAETLRGLVQTGQAWLLKFWNFELFTAVDTIEVEGQSITGKRSITVNKVVTVILVLTVGIWVAGRLARSLRWILSRRSRVDEGSAILVQRLVYISFVFVLVFFALTLFKIPFTVFAFLGGALAIATGFGAQNLINNFISGLILLIERPIKLGDIVEVEGVRGTVASIGVRFSEIKRFDGVDILFPNSLLLEKQVTNWTLSDQRVRVQVEVAVPHGSPVLEVIRLLEQAVAEHGEILPQPKPQVLFEEFGDGGLIFHVHFWVVIDSYMDYKIIASDMRVRIERLLRGAGIEIAFPHWDVTLACKVPLDVKLQR